MTDKEKMSRVLEYCDGSFEQIIFEYLASNHKDFFNSKNSQFDF